LAAIQQQLLQTGIDSRIVVNDIIRYAGAPGWADGVLDFTEVFPPPSPPSPWEETLGSPTPEVERSPTDSLVESLRKGQITDGPRVSQLETDLREVLNTSAGLASASENLRLQGDVYGLTVIATRLQGNVYRLTIVATIVAVIAVVVAVMTPILS
jgi:hypothetical protein